MAELEPGKEVEVGNLSVHRNWDGGRLFVVAVTPLSKAKELILDRLFCRLPKTKKQVWVFRNFNLDEQETEEVMVALLAALKALASVSPAPG